MKTATQRFQSISATLRELNQAGLKLQTVNDLLTMYVGAASQHALRTTFVPREEAVSFDKEIVSYWSQLAGRDVTSPLFHLPLRLGGLGVDSAVHRHAAAPWTAWLSIIPTLMEATESPDIDSLFASTPILRGQLHQLQVTLSQQMDTPSLLLKSLGAALRVHGTQKVSVNTIQQVSHQQLLTSLSANNIQKAILISQTAKNTGAHLQQPSSESYEADDRCFQVSLARRLMLPCPAASHPANISAPSKRRYASFTARRSNDLWTRRQLHMILTTLQTEILRCERPCSVLRRNGEMPSTRNDQRKQAVHAAVRQALDFHIAGQKSCRASVYIITVTPVCPIKQ